MDVGLLLRGVARTRDSANSEPGGPTTRGARGGEEVASPREELITMSILGFSFGFSEGFYEDSVSAF